MSLIYFGTVSSSVMFHFVPSFAVLAGHGKRRGVRLLSGPDIAGTPSFCLTCFTYVPWTKCNNNKKTGVFFAATLRVRRTHLVQTVLVSLSWQRKHQVEEEAKHEKRQNGHLHHRHLHPRSQLYLNSTVSAPLSRISAITKRLNPHSSFSLHIAHR